MARDGIQNGECKISVRVEDVDDPHDGVDQVSGIQVLLSGLRNVVFESPDASLHAATDGALAGVERAVGRTLQRRRMEPLKQAA